MENNSKWGFGIIVSVFIISFCILLCGFTSEVNSEPTVVYNVYLDGESIGVIPSRNSFEQFINTKEEELKKRYGVDTVYTPEGVEIKKNLTYNSYLNTNEYIYNKIITTKKFTVHGFEITIDNPDEEDDEKVIYVLSKEVFDEAINTTIKVFVDEMKYDKFMNGTQEEIKDLGSIIENIDLYENITYKEILIPTNKKIFIDVHELSRYLLYGTLKEQDTYIVKVDDTIETVASAHKLNVQELLIANPDLTSVNNLLYESQELNVGLINPLISVMVDIHSVEEEERGYDTEIQYDDTQYIGYQSVLREGENGLYKVTRKLQYVNGQLSSATVANSTVIKPAVNKIIVKGDKYAPSVADLSYWAWPTERPYTITSYYGWRWGEFHDALDIYVGYGSAIYAANNGVVARVGTGCYAGDLSCNGRQGNFVVINHNAGGYYTIYMHMKDVNVSVGQTVARGQKIGTMGNTGNVYPVPSSYNPYGGTHLHFSVRVGSAYGAHINPLGLY